MSISFRNEIANLYLACLVVQLITQYSYLSSLEIQHNHTSMILNSIDKVINILSPNQAINSYMNDSYMNDTYTSNTTLDICFPNDLDQIQYIYQKKSYLKLNLSKA